MLSRTRKAELKATGIQLAADALLHHASDKITTICLKLNDEEDAYIRNLLRVWAQRIEHRGKV
jgi:hypothetical protein